MRPILILILLSISASLYSQKILTLGDGKSPKANIDEVAWIAGHWKAENFGFTNEEIWTAPLGGSMMGIHRSDHENYKSYYEIRQITQEDETLIFRLKPFFSDLTSFKEKEYTRNFELVKIEKDVVYFDSLTIRQVSKDRINLLMLVKDAGEIYKMKYKYHRVK
jgi:hypothetical protein